MNAAAPSAPPPSLPAQPWELSVVVPACNAEHSLVDTLDRLSRLPGGHPREIVVVENGSRDGTWDLLQSLQKDWDRPTRLIVLRSERGIGCAYRAGTAVTTGDRVLLTADDLPFGDSDLEAVLACRTLPDFAIGSKAHPRSRVPRTTARRIATAVFRVARRVVLGLDVGDTQGTFVLDGTLGRRLVAATRFPGFGMTTELVALAVADGTDPVELPVVLRSSTSPSRIHWLSDSVGMLTDLLRLRRRIGGPRRRHLVALPTDAHV